MTNLIAEAAAKLRHAGHHKLACDLISSVYSGYLYDEYPGLAPGAIDMLETLSISGFYVKEDPCYSKMGLRCNEKLIFLDGGEVPDHIRAQARNNSQYYCAQLSKSLGESAVRLRLPNLEPGYVETNPSILQIDDGRYIGRYIGIIRTVNYRYKEGRYLLPEGQEVHQTINYLVEFTPDLKNIKSSLKLHVPEVNHPKDKIRGIEDLRLINFTDGFITAIGTVASNKCLNSMYLITIDLSDGEVTEVERLSNGEQCEKNWVPTTPCGVLISHPSTLNPKLKGFRGSSQWITTEKFGLVSVIHDVAINTNGLREYIHRFATSISVSKPFKFFGGSIEYCCGLSTHGDDFILSVSNNDCEAYLLRVSPEEVEKLFE